MFCLRGLCKWQFSLHMSLLLVVWYAQMVIMGIVCLHKQKGVSWDQCYKMTMSFMKEHR